MLRRQLSSPLDKNISAKNIYSPLKIFAGLFPTFFLHMERGDGKKVFLLASRRRVKSSTCSVNININIYTWSNNMKNNAYLHMITQILLGLRPLIFQLMCTTGLIILDFSDNFPQFISFTKQKEQYCS